MEYPRELHSTPIPSCSGLGNWLLPCYQLLAESWILKLPLDQLICPLKDTPGTWSPTEFLLLPGPH